LWISARALTANCALNQLSQNIHMPSPYSNLTAPS
jgi:hypothetical protein